MQTNTQKIVKTSLFAALCCVVTMVIQIPSPFKGYINLGDSIVLLAGWILSPFYGFLAAGIGSGCADLFSGYIVYAPVTFLIKGLMAVNAYYSFKIVNKVLGNTLSQIVSGAGSLIIKTIGYFIFEGFIYGFVPAMTNIPASLVQSVIGLILGVVLVKTKALHIVKKSL